MRVTVRMVINYTDLELFHLNGSFDRRNAPSDVSIELFDIDDGANFAKLASNLLVGGHIFFKVEEGGVDSRKRASRQSKRQNAGSALDR